MVVVDRVFGSAWSWRRHTHPTARYWFGEAATALLPGAAALSIFGMLGAAVYVAHDGVLSCSSAANSGYDGVTIFVGSQVPSGCTKSVDMPVLGWASSWQQAAVMYGWWTALIVFVLAFGWLAAKQWRLSRTS